MLILVAAMVGGRGISASASGDEGSTPNDPSKSEQEKKTRIRGMLWLRQSESCERNNVSDDHRPQTIRDGPEQEGKSTF